MGDENGKWNAATLLAGMFLGAAIFVVLNGMPSWPAWPAVPWRHVTGTIEAADLEAQQSMANAAWYMFVAAAISTFVGAAGLFGLFWTLRVTQETTRVTREIGEAQARAYVIISRATLHLNGMGLPVATFTVTNSGQTPAINLNVVLRAHVEVRDGDDWRVNVIGKKTIYFPELAASKDDVAEIMIGKLFDQGMLQSMVLGTIRIAVSGQVRYSTVFGGPRDRDDFAYRSRKLTIISGNPKNPTPMVRVRYKIS